jgi:hypothetical protein
MPESVSLALQLAWLERFLSIGLDSVVLGTIPMDTSGRCDTGLLAPGRPARGYRTRALGENQLGAPRAGRRLASCRSLVSRPG